MKRRTNLLFLLQLLVIRLYAGEPLVIQNNQTFEQLSGISLTITGKADVHITSSTTPLVASSVNLTGVDTWLYFDNVRPDDVVQRYKDSIFINNAVMAPGVNCRIAVYKHGTAIVPHGSSFKPLEVFLQPDFGGASQQYALQVYNRSLGTFNNAIQSFKLKKGYLATFANILDGTGYSRCFIADNEDLLVSQLPPELNKKISFIRVFPWEWVTKKGWGGTATDTDTIKGTWRWDWSASGNSETGIEYVPIKEHKYWPSWSTISAKNTATHLMGYCEPDNGENRSTVDETIAEWPNMLKTGLRLGTPSAINVSWIYEFLDKCEAKRYRVDFVTIHCYWAAKPASQWYSDLKKIYDRTKRPLWITEWNTGGNWTNEPWPSDSLQALQKQLTDIKAILNVLDTASFVERYSIYNWVENKRAMIIKNVKTPAGEYYANNKSVIAFDRSKEVIPNSNVVPTNVDMSFSSTGAKMAINWYDYNLELLKGYNVEKKINDGNYQKVFEPASLVDRTYNEELQTMQNGDKYTFRVNAVGVNDELAPSTEMSVIASKGDTLLQYGNAPVSNKVTNTIFSFNPYKVKPIVVTGSPSYENTIPMTQSLQTVGNQTVSFRLRPWVYVAANEFTNTVKVPFIILPKGEQTIGNLKLQTGTATINKTTWTNISFTNPFETTPVVLPTLAGSANSIPVTVRIKDVSANGFSAILKSEQAQTGSFLPETINYLAVTPGSGTFNGKKVKVGITPASSVGGAAETYRLNFGETVSNPVFLCAMQTYNDTITATLRYRQLSESGVTMLKQREISKSTTTVTKETAGWLVLEGIDTVSGVSDINDKKIVVFPNPAKDYIYIGGLDQPALVEIYNLYGQCILKDRFENKLNVTGLKSGIYILKINGVSSHLFKQ